MSISGISPVSAYSPARPGPMPSIPQLGALVAGLGVYTRPQMDGTVMYNEPLVQQIVQFREAALPALQNFFNGVNSIPAFVEGLYAAGKLAEARIPNVESLYPALVRWNSHPDPLVQMELARFYRKINEPKTFGPMLSTMVNYAVSQYPMQASPAYNVTEETGETVLKQIARYTADETVQRLIPYLQPFLMQQQPRKN